MVNTFNWCNTPWMPRMNYGIIHIGQSWMWFDADQIWLNDISELMLYVQKKPRKIIYDGTEYNPQIACGTFKSVQSYSNGTFRVDIQLPKGRNLWPSFWLVGEGEWPKNGEIDVCECWSNKCGSYFRGTIPQPPYVVPSWDTTTNIHWEENGEHKSVGSRRLPIIFSLKNPTNHFIRYEVEWGQDIITFKVNGKVVRVYGYDVAKKLYNTKQYVVFNLWTTGLDYTLESPMIIKNFEYKPIEIL